MNYYKYVKVKLYIRYRLNHTINPKYAKLWCDRLYYLDRKYFNLKNSLMGD